MGLNQLRIDHSFAYNFVSDDIYYLLFSENQYYACMFNWKKEIKQNVNQCREKPYAMMRLTNKMNNK